MSFVPVEVLAVELKPITRAVVDEESWVGSKYNLKVWPLLTYPLLGSLEKPVEDRSRLTLQSRERYDVSMLKAVLASAGTPFNGRPSIEAEGMLSVLEVLYHPFASALFDA